MKEDLDNLFKNKSKEKRVYKGSSRVIPGLFLFATLFPLFVVWLLFCKPFTSFLVAKNIEYLSSLFYIFFAFSIIVAILLEIVQPFSTTSNKQKKKGRLLRKMAYFVMMGYLFIVAFGTILFFSDFNSYILMTEEFCGVKDLIIPF